jgi:hypothetical protein
MKVAEDWIATTIASVSVSDLDVALRNPPVEVLDDIGRNIEISDGCYELASVRRIWNSKIDRVMADLNGGRGPTR